MDLRRIFGVSVGPELGWSSWVRVLAGVALLCFSADPVFSQGVPWKVKPQWVRAHEEFLASDAMAGRGSATRDEEVAATYVASQFLSYGLQPAPGMTGYVQTASILAPELDGHALLSLGSVTLEEGKGLRLLLASGTDVSASLVKHAQNTPLPAQMPRSAALLLTGSFDAKALSTTVRSARKAGVGLLLLPEGEAADELTAQWGGNTRVPMRLADSPAKPSLTMAAVSAQALAKIAQIADGTTITLTTHQVAYPARATYNAIGYLKGSDPASGTLLLTAHLDHLGVGKAVGGDSIYNGANDDAAGTTAVLELAHALSSGPKLRRSVLFVCYGSEEAGELGSEYFGRHSPVPIKDLVANLEFEMIGTQDPKMPKDTLLLTGWDRSNLGPTLKAHGARLGPDPYPEQHFFERSDNYQLALQGVVAHTAAGYGTPSTYHQPNDDLAHLNLEFMTTAIQSLIEPVRWLAESDFKPSWTRDGQPHR